MVACWVDGCIGVPVATRPLTVLATVLAAVAEFGGPDVSKTCSRLVSVKSSFGGVNSTAGSDDTMLGEGGVFGTSEFIASAGIGGGRAGMSGSLSAESAGCSAGAFSTGASLDGFLATGAGVGRLNMLAQLLVPSGLKLGFGGSGEIVGAASAALMFSQDESKPVPSVSAALLVEVSAETSSFQLPTTAVSEMPLSATAVLRGAATAEAPRPPRTVPRPRSDARPRPRVASAPPLPRPPRVDPCPESEMVGPPSFALGCDRSLVFFFTSPHCEILPRHKSC